MKAIQALLFSLLLPSFDLAAQSTNAPAAPTAPPKNLKPLVHISSFSETQATGWHYHSERTMIGDPVKIFRIQFRITDDSVTALDTGKIYFFDNDKALIHTIEIETGASRQTLMNTPNLISSLSGLKKGKSYNIVVPYNPAQIKWRTAIVVMGAKEQFTAKTSPASAKIKDFEFKEKDRTIED